MAERIGARRYLEVGVRNPQDNFDKITCLERTAVDPKPCSLPAFGKTWELFCMTSDQFFTAYPVRRFDLIFVDGDHTAEQVSADVRNALRRIDLSGCIVMHDCNPPDERHTSGALCGTAYRAFLELRQDRTLTCLCVDCDYGVGVVRMGANPNPLQFPKEYTYADFADHRAEWLNLIEPENF